MADLWYDQCRAASCWSVPSHASMFTGLLPSQHGVHTHAPKFSKLTPEETLLHDLPEYTTLGASANVYASSSFGFAGLFDAFDDVAPYRRFRGGIDVQRFLRETDETGIRRWIAFLRAALTSNASVASVANGFFVKITDILASLPLEQPFDDGGELVVSRANRLIGDAEEPFFLFTNFMEAHGPFRASRMYDDSLYDVPTGWSSDEIDIWEYNNADSIDASADQLVWYRELYSAAIDYLDRLVSDFITDVLDQTELETTVLVTSDHGENLGFATDGHLLGHTSSLSEGLLHVPLVVVNPPQTDSEAVTGHCSQLDFPQLVSGLATDTVPDIERDRVPAEVIGISQTSRDPENYDRWNRARRAVVRNSEKVVWDSAGSCIRHRINSDRPSEQFDPENLEEVPAWSRSLFDQPLEAYERAARERSGDPTLPSHVTDRLNELGYL